MNNLIERYVYDVVRRLPEKDREEVSRELKSNIYDMLSDHADENEIKAVLYELGSPSSLAEKYRQKPQYLISPAYYDDYVRVLKWVVPLVGIIVLVIGMVFGAIKAIENDMVDVSYFISRIISGGISSGASAAFMTLFWTTVGFVIADRTTKKADNGVGREWKIEDLPEMMPEVKNRIPLSDSISELVVIVIFSVVTLLLCTGLLSLPFALRIDDIQIYHIFSPSFLASCIPAIVVIALFSICKCTFKIKDRRWTPFVCSAVIIDNLVSICVMLYLFNKPNIFSEEFIMFVNSNEWGSFDLMRFMGNSVANQALITLCAIIVICSLAECGAAIYKTMKTK